MKPATILLIVFFTFHSTIASSQSDKIFSPETYWGVSIVPMFIKKGHIDGDAGKYNLRSSPQPGGEALINYYYNFEPNYSVVFSAGGALLVHNFNYEIPKNLFDSVGGRGISFNPVGPIKMSSGYLKAQVELQSKFFRNQKKSWLGALGLSLLYPIQDSDEYSAGILWGSNSQSAQEYVIIQYPHYQHKPLLNCHLTGGYEWILHTGNLLQAVLKLDYMPVNIVTSTYDFKVGHQPQIHGNYSISGSYLGLCLSYVFSKNRKI